MDLRFIETLVTVVDAASLAAAARSLRVTPAAVAQRIAALEAELQVSLIQRAGRGMVATPDCEVLLPEFRKLLAIRAGLSGVLSQDQLQGALRLGAVSTALGDYSADLVRGMEAQAPRVDMTLVPGASSDLYQLMLEENLDAALLVEPPFDLPKSLDFIPIVQQPIGLLRPAQGEQDLPFLIYAREAWGGAACLKVLRRHVETPRVLCEMDSLETIAQLVEDWVGQAVVPQWAGLRRRHPDLQFTPLGDAQRCLGLLRWQRDVRRPIQQVLRQILAG